MRIARARAQPSRCLRARLGSIRSKRICGAVSAASSRRCWRRNWPSCWGGVATSVPRARLVAADGTTQEWRSAALPRYARMTRQAEALIASAYLAGTNTRRVKRALGALFKGAVGKDVVSRSWRRVKADWEAWNRRSLADEDIVRLVLDGTVVRVRLDRKATSISLLVVLGIRSDGQKVLLSVRDMGGESEAAWRGVLDDLLSHAPEKLHDEITADYTDMIYAGDAKEVEKRRHAFLRKWRLKCRAVADSLEEAGDRLFTFTRLPSSQWKSARTTNAIERLHEEFKRRIKTQTVLPSAETAAMLFWALLASGQIVMRKVDGWRTLAQKPADQMIDLAA